MPMLLKGSCRCGAVRFEVESHTPAPYQLCYCSICRKQQGGGGYAINLGALNDTMAIKGKENLGVYRAEIEDVAQEAFIKAYRALPQFRGESAFYTWLYRIAINTARNWLASQGRRPSAPNAIETEDGETFNETDNLTDISTPESMVASREIADTVNAAIEELPEELRTAIVLREIEGMSYEDIAQSMDCPIGTVRSRIFRAREAIASRLRPLLDTDAERRW